MLPVLNDGDELLINAAAYRRHEQTLMVPLGVSPFLLFSFMQRWNRFFKIPLLLITSISLVGFIFQGRRKPAIGDIVHAKRPDRPEVEMVKRITAVTGDGRYFLRGDNPLASTDSRHFGPVAASDILGKVTSKFG